MEFKRNEYIELIGAMPEDGSYINIEALAAETGFEIVQVVQMLWNLHLSGKIRLSIDTCLSKKTIKKLKEAKANGKH